MELDNYGQSTFLILEDIKIGDGAPVSLVEFRRSLTTSFFFKFWLNVTYKLEHEENHVHDLHISSGSISQ